MAQAFSLFGSKVTMLIRSKRIMKNEEAAASLILHKSLEEDGVRILLNTICMEMSKAEGSEEILIQCVDSEKNVGSISTSHVFIATGKKPNVNNMGLEAAGVKFNLEKGVLVNDYLQTSNKNIYAVGDCCSKFKVATATTPCFTITNYKLFLNKAKHFPQFTHIADFMARKVIRNALFFGTSSFSSLIIPWCTFTFPEIAHVGSYKRDLKKNNIHFSVHKKKFSDLDRAILDSETDGYIQILVKEGTDKVLGCTIVGDHAGEMISEVTLLMTCKLGLPLISETIHPYPTQSDVIRHVADIHSKDRMASVTKTMFHKIMAARRL